MNPDYADCSVDFELQTDGEISICGTKYSVLTTSDQTKYVVQGCAYVCLKDCSNLFLVYLGAESKPSLKIQVGDEFESNGAVNARLSAQFLCKKECCRESDNKCDDHCAKCD